jgi:hypothetical protein
MSDVIEKMDYKYLKETFDLIRNNSILDASGNPVLKEDIRYYMKVGFLSYILSRSKVTLGSVVCIRFYQPEMNEQEFEFFKESFRDVLVRIAGGGGSNYRFDTVFRGLKVELFLQYMFTGGFFSQVDVNSELKQKIMDAIEIKVEPVKFEGVIRVVHLAYVCSIFLDSLKVSKKGRVMLFTQKKYYGILKMFFDFPDVKIQKRKIYNKEDKGKVLPLITFGKEKKKSDISRLFLRMNSGWFNMFSGFADLQDYIMFKSDLFKSLVDFYKFDNIDNLLQEKKIKIKRNYITGDDLKLKSGEKDAF